ncbi:MAG: ribosome maturation factor RimP [Alphaproteobacteria bacterium]|nr:ribosome maturation factor RimP [Alphaproteobacteria bacterium]
MTTPLEHKIETIARPVAGDLGLEIICVRIIGEGGSRNVQILAENPATRNLSLDDCAKLSKGLSAILDVEDPIEGAYRLEVSSPGIDRPLIREKDFEDFKGFEAKIETQTPSENGQKRYRGRIKGIDNGVISLETDTGVEAIPFSGLSKARLVLTDDLIKATANM